MYLMVCQQSGIDNEELRKMVETILPEIFKELRQPNILLSVPRFIVLETPANENNYL